MQTMNEVFTDFLTNGLFTYLNEQNVPWAETVSADMLNLAYHGGHSGQKNISSLVRTIKDSETLSDSEREILAVTLVSMFGTNWNKLWATLSFVYDPIENYRMVEEMENDDTTYTFGKTNTRTNNLSHAKTGTETETINLSDTKTEDKTGTDTRTLNLSDSRTEDKSGTETRTLNLEDTKTEEKDGQETQTKNLTDTRTPNLTNETERTIAGFNSSGNGMPEGSETTTATGTETMKQTGTDTRVIDDTIDVTESHTGTDATAFDTELDIIESHTGTDTMLYNTEISESGTRSGTDSMQHNTTELDTGTQTDAETGTNTTEHEYTLTRSGNIGVTTSQQMIESERALWIWNFFYDTVFPDIDKMLTLSVY